MPLESARLTLAADGTPMSASYGDVYYAADGGHAQARHVFLAGNGLPARWQGREGFTILETGFGLGLNFLATWNAWRADLRRCRELHFISLEKHPLAAADLASAHAVWPELADLATQLQRLWPPLVAGAHRLEFEGGRLLLTLIFEDALEALSTLAAPVDAFYLDGFSPARNPALWSAPLCAALARLAVPGATLATWSVAGGVRRALTAAQFAVEKRGGFARKRQMLVGRYAPISPASHVPAFRSADVDG
jgi:tRNA 5-methylaminomethyl-2-thiouridine biosynthesis bifunctional protein